MKSQLFVVLGLIVLFLGLGFLLPGWIMFQLSLALAKGTVTLGVVVLLRGGLISFGQALFYAIGAYAVGFVMNRFGIQDAVIAIVLGTAFSAFVAALIGLFTVRYRQIYFAMLSLAFSMVLYGLMLKLTEITGGSDGMGIGLPTILGLSLPVAESRLILYLFTVICVALALLGVHRYLRSPLSYLMQAIRDNELRVEYLGTSARRAIYLTYLLAGGLGGLGGSLVALNVGHVDPGFAFWTTSAEFVVVAVLGGTGSVLAPMSGSIVFEFSRSYATQYAPLSWRLILGLVLLIIVLFLPGGLWALYQKAVRRIEH